jgi:hypothetical protein
MNTTKYIGRQDLARRLDSLCRDFRFTWGQPASRSDGVIDVSLDRTWDDEDRLECLGTVFAGFPPDPDVVRSLSWTIRSDETGQIAKVGWTDRRGQFRLRGLEPGDYRLTIQVMPRLHREKKRDEWVREAAAEAPGQVAEAQTAALSELLPRLLDQRVDVRAEAAEALGRVRAVSVEVYDRLRDALNDRSGEVRRAAARGLRRLGVSAEPTITAEFVALCAASDLAREDYHAEDGSVLATLRLTPAQRLVLEAEANIDTWGEHRLARFRIWDDENHLLAQGYIGLHEAGENKAFGQIDLATFSPGLRDRWSPACHLEVIAQPCEGLTTHDRTDLEHSLAATEHGESREVLEDALKRLTGGQA